MKVISLLIFFVFISLLTFAQNELYQINKRTYFREAPGKISNSRKIDKGEKIQLIGYEDYYIKIKYNGEIGYIWRKNNLFKNEKALNKIDQLYFEYYHEKLLNELNISEVPKKNDNTIVIQSNLSAKEGYKTFGKYLTTRNFTFDKKDDEFFSITTVYKVLKQKRNDYLRYRLIVTFFDKEIKIRIEYNDLESLSYNKVDESGYFKNWCFIPSEKISQNLIFWDIAPIIEGLEKEYHYSQNIEFIDDDNQSKFKAMLELDYGIGIGEYGLNRGGIDLILGSQVNPNFSIGLGVAVQNYTSNVFVNPKYDEPILPNFTGKLIPLFADFRTNFTNNLNSPFWATKIGFKFSSGPFISSKIGYQFKINTKGKIFFGIGYELFRSDFNKLNDHSYSIENIKNNIQTIGLSLGYTYN